MSTFNLTVKEASELLLLASKALNKSHPSLVCESLGLGRSTQRTWTKGLKINPNELSKMRYVHYLTLKAIVGQPVLKPVSHKVEIPAQYIMNAKNYKCPPVGFLAKLIGINGVLKLSRVEIAELLMMNRKKLSEAVANEKLTFTTYSLLLLLAGVDPRDIYK